MKTAAIPVDEELRLNDLFSYDILDSEREQDFDDLVELASQICDCPIALITFVDKERQWFKASKQMDGHETSRNVAFCAHTILQDEVLMVSDALKDERFFDNPSVTDGVKIKFYAGAPIVSSSGFRLGSVCVIDNIPKIELTDKQKNALTIIAAQVSKLLELRVKNKIIVRHAEAQVAAEKRISQLTLIENDKKNNFIAFELHENLAQSLVATKLFLESAQESKDLSDYFLQKSKESITDIINEIKKLSKTIIPTTLQNTDFFWLIRDHATRYCQQHGMKIKFGTNRVIKNFNANFGVNLFQVIQSQLEISRNCGAKNILLDIQQNNAIVLTYKDDGRDECSHVENTTLMGTIITRIESVKGEVTRNFNGGGNDLYIELPV